MAKFLLQNLTNDEYEAACKLSLAQCKYICSLVNLRIQFEDPGKPGKELISVLNIRGCSARRFKELVKESLKIKFFKPQSKIAILIANQDYKSLSKLATPSKDCDAIKNELVDLGFLVVILENCATKDLRVILEEIFKVIPERSYCFMFYGGHGCEINNTKYILDVQCPENATIAYCITENFLLGSVAKSKPELCLLILDMCRINWDRDLGPETTEQYNFDDINNYTIVYTTRPGQKAYECVQYITSTSLGSDTIEMNSGNMSKFIANASNYVKHLCNRLADGLEVNFLLDKVHADMEKTSMKNQTPIKVQCGVAKRYLQDPVSGNTAELLGKLQEIGKSCPGCSVFDKR